MNLGKPWTGEAYIYVDESGRKFLIATRKDLPHILQIFSLASTFRVRHGCIKSCVWLGETLKSVRVALARPRLWTPRNLYPGVMRGIFSRLRWRKRVDGCHTRLKLYPNTEIKTSSQSILFKEKCIKTRHAINPSDPPNLLLVSPLLYPVVFIL